MGPQEVKEELLHPTSHPPPAITRDSWFGDGVNIMGNGAAWYNYVARFVWMTYEMLLME